MAFTVATSLGWDIGRAVTTAVGVALVGAPVLRLLRRTAARAAFVPAVFVTERPVDGPAARDAGRPAPSEPLPR